MVCRAMWHEIYHDVYFTLIVRHAIAKALQFRCVTFAHIGIVASTHSVALLTAYAHDAAKAMYALEEKNVLFFAAYMTSKAHAMNHASLQDKLAHLAIATVRSATRFRFTFSVRAVLDGYSTKIRGSKAYRSNGRFVGSMLNFMYRAFAFIKTNMRHIYTHRWSIVRNSLINRIDTYFCDSTRTPRIISRSTPLRTYAGRLRRRSKLRGVARTRAITRTAVTQQFRSGRLAAKLMRRNRVRLKIRRYLRDKLLRGTSGTEVGRGTAVAIRAGYGSSIANARRKRARAMRILRRRAFRAYRRFKLSRKQPFRFRISASNGRSSGNRRAGIKTQSFRGRRRRLSGKRAKRFQYKPSVYRMFRMRRKLAYVRLKDRINALTRRRGSARLFRRSVLYGVALRFSRYHNKKSQYVRQISSRWGKKRKESIHYSNVRRFLQFHYN
jgi:intracellular sulfur oxidation DsrE/DsrF family protein